MISFSLLEFRDLILMSLILGIIFKDVVPANLILKRKPTKEYFDMDNPDNIYNEYYARRRASIFGRMASYFDYSYWFSLVVIAPAIVLHEMSHKIVAQYLGLASTFYASYNFLAFALVLKVIAPMFIFFVPGYVMTACVNGGGHCIASAAGLVPDHFASAVVAISGPMANLFLWFVATMILKYHFANQRLIRGNKTFLLATVITQKLNIFLFILNLLPIPGFDGFHFYYNIYKMIF